MTDALGIEIMPVSSPDDAVADVDIVMCSTNSIEAVFFEKWIRPGLHVSSIKVPEIEQVALAKASRVGLHYGQQRS